ncbi:DUF4123 domain-containing protein [Pseudomonas sp. NPDC098747]|uniref:DUF4123 domain-containing protein n=1 Tax=Pseudomonas sp. NPDC098747 TaxID=3364487 RepID=UPI00383A8BA1
MTTPIKWLETQVRLERTCYLILDSCGQLDERSNLVNELGVERYRNLYLETPVAALASIGPYLFKLAYYHSAALLDLLNQPRRNWGWLASSANGDLEVITEHWQARLMKRQPPNQAVYRFHDNRVLGNALEFLLNEEYPAYLGPLSSVCYWHEEQWNVADNPTPGFHPLPFSPTWHRAPTPGALA